MQSDNPYNSLADAIKQLKIYDTLSETKESFVPRETAKIFLCGPTVYDLLHLGHARMLLFYDLVARYLRFLGVRTKVVANITDIDPKVFVRAKEESKPPEDLATFYIEELLRDTVALGIEGFSFARVSDYVEMAQVLTRRLLDEGKAYSTGGNIYLDAKLAGFGRLSKMSDEELADSRLDIAPGKREPFDILLWNGSDNFKVSFPDRILGTGIPWWHMQDTAVAMANFAGTYDIHGGANELIYPHHESHLAQLSLLTSDKMPVRLWMHVGLVHINGKKMSKSLGNTITVRELLQGQNINTLRLYLYSTNYRNRLDFESRDLAKWAEIDRMISSSVKKKKISKSYQRKFMQKLNDDFDTQGAIEVMLEAARLEICTAVMAGILGLRY
jgi:cysteinyl-tRNA synthetase